MAMESGERLVLLHGLGASSRVWRPVLASLAAHRDVLAINLPGHLGGPDLGPEPPTPGVLADGVIAELDAAGIGTAHLVGNSLGASLALELAGRGRARSVVAIAPIGLLEPREQRRLVGGLRRSHRIASLLGPIARLLAGWSFGRRLLFGEVLHRPAALPPEEARAWVDAFVGCSGFGAIVDALDQHPYAFPAELDCPVCIAWPTADRMTPQDPFARRFAAAFPASSSVRLHDCGHTPMSDAPERVASLILEHTTLRDSGSVRRVETGAARGAG